MRDGRYMCLSSGLPPWRKQRQDNSGETKLLGGRASQGSAWREAQGHSYDREDSISPEALVPGVETAMGHFPILVIDPWVSKWVSVWLALWYFLELLWLFFSPLPCFLGLSRGEHLGDPSFSPHCSCQNLNPASSFSDLLRVEINICWEECILISVASSPGENRSKTNLQTHRLNAS